MDSGCVMERDWTIYPFLLQASHVQSKYMTHNKSLHTAVAFFIFFANLEAFSETMKLLVHHF